MKKFSKPLIYITRTYSRDFSECSLRMGYIGILFGKFFDKYISIPWFNIESKK